MLKDPFKCTYNIIKQDAIDTLRNIRKNASHILFTSSLNDNVDDEIIKNEPIISKFNDLLNQINQKLNNNADGDETKRPVRNLYNYIMGEDFVPNANTETIQKLNKIGVKGLLYSIIREDAEQVKYLYNILTQKHELDLSGKNPVPITTGNKNHDIILRELFDHTRHGMGKGEVLLAIFFNLLFEKTEGCDLKDSEGNFFEVKSFGGCINTDFQGNIKSTKNNLYYIYITNNKDGIQYIVKSKTQVQNFIKSILKESNSIVINNKTNEQKNLNDPTLQEWPDNWRVKDSYYQVPNEYVMVAPRSGGGFKIPWQRFKSI